MKPATAALLADFVRGGGKLLACFGVPAELAALLGVTQGQYRAQRFGGEFSTMRFAGSPPEGAPVSVAQASWAVIDAQPVAGVGSVAAWWHDASGKQTDAPAIISSANGAWVSHIILKDDPAAKGALLLGLAAQFVPELRRQASARRLALVGTSVSQAGWQEVVRQIEALPDFAATAAPAALREATASLEKGKGALAAGDWSGVNAAADRADEQLSRAYCLAQRPVQPEFRGTWCHPREGIAAWGWEKTAAHLARSGFTDLFLNVLHGASTSYPSQFAPLDRS